MTESTDLFIGIDVAFAKRKRLPICIGARRNGQFAPISIPLDISADHPRGHGNKGTLDPDLVNVFADEVATYLRRIEARVEGAIRRVAIDAPYAPALDKSDRRQCEAEFALRFGTSAIFKTPNQARFEQMCAKAKIHLEGGGMESKFPDANRLWMLVGFALFRRLQTEWECIEVYPHATMRCLGAADIHKRKMEGVMAQLTAVSRHTRWPSPMHSGAIRELRDIVQAPGHDAVDAYASAWIAALEPPDRLPLGCPPNDAIWVPGHKFCASAPLC